MDQPSSELQYIEKDIQYGEEEVTSELEGHGHCYIHYFDIVLCIFYGLLCFRCWKLLVKHYHPISLGRASGLACYLFFSFLFCLLRMISFFLLLSIDPLCNYSYRTDSYFDAIEIADQSTKGLKYLELMISAIALICYNTSFSYFSYSLTKVFYMLTSSSSRYERLSSKLLSIFVGLTLCFWISAILIWISSMIRTSITGFIFVMGRIAISISCMIISLFLGTTLFKSILYWRENGSDSGRGLQIFSLLHMRRVQLVCFVSIFVFSFRGIVLLSQINLTPVLENLFLILFEILPTALMLHVFRR